MKIAYCFAGHARTWRKCYESFFKHVYLKNPGQIYIHTWEYLTQVTPSYWNDYKGISGEFTNQKLDVKDLSRTYLPTKLLVESARTDLSVPGFGGNRTFDFSLKPFYEARMKSLYLALERAEDEPEFVFMLRPDIEFLSDFDFSCPEKTLVCAKHAGLIASGYQTDLFFYGRLSEVETACEYYWSMDSLYFRNPNRENYHECAWTNYMRVNQINLIASDVLFQIPRVDGTVTTFA